MKKEPKIHPIHLPLASMILRMMEEDGVIPKAKE
jgi:hypothetical protein